MIAVIDYKAGNLTSVMKALHALGRSAEITADPAVVRRADKVILPGVGHFQATKLLGDTGLTAAVRETDRARACRFWGYAWVCNGSSPAARRLRE